MKSNKNHGSAQNKKFKLVNPIDHPQYGRLWQLQSKLDLNSLVTKDRLGGLVSDENVLDWHDGSWIHEGSIVVRDHERAVHSFNGILPLVTMDASIKGESVLIKSIVRGGEVRHSMLRNSESNRSDLKNAYLHWSKAYDESTILNSFLSNGVFHGVDLDYCMTLTYTVMTGFEAYGALVIDSDDWFMASNVGSENGTLFSWITFDGRVKVRRGCCTEQLDDFKAKVARVYADDSKGRANYNRLLSYTKERLKPGATNTKTKLMEEWNAREIIQSVDFENFCSTLRSHIWGLVNIPEIKTVDIEEEGLPA